MMIHGFSFFWRRGVGGWAPTPFIPHKTCAKKGATRQGPGTSQGAAGSRGEGTHGPVGARAARTPPATRERSRPSTNTSSRRRGVESAAVSRLDLPPRPSASRAPANHRGVPSPAVSDAAAVAHTLNTPDDDDPRVFFFLAEGSRRLGADSVHPTQDMCEKRCDAAGARHLPGSGGEPRGGDAWPSRRAGCTNASGDKGALPSIHKHILSPGGGWECR